MWCELFVFVCDCGVCVMWKVDCLRVGMDGEWRDGVSVLWGLVVVGLFVFVRLG